MQREIKFRAWDGAKMDYDPMGDEYLCEGTPINDLFARPYKGQVIMQFTGLKDKKGTEIYEDDLIRVKCGIGDEKDIEAGRYHDGYYRAVIDPLNGLVLSFVKLVNEDPLNQFPIHANLCTRYSTLDVDYRNQKYDQIAVMETWGENHTFKNRWKQNHWSNDLEVIGNAHENPTLLSTPQLT